MDSRIGLNTRASVTSNAERIALHSFSYNAEVDRLYVLRGASASITQRMIQGMFVSNHCKGLFVMDANEPIWIFDNTVRKTIDCDVLHHRAAWQTCIRCDDCDRLSHIQAAIHACDKEQHETSGDTADATSQIIGRARNELRKARSTLILARNAHLIEHATECFRSAIEEQHALKSACDALSHALRSRGLCRVDAIGWLYPLTVHELPSFAAYSCGTRNTRN